MDLLACHSLHDFLSCVSYFIPSYTNSFHSAYSLKLSFQFFLSLSFFPFAIVSFFRKLLCSMWYTNLLLLFHLLILFLNFVYMIHFLSPFVLFSTLRKNYISISLFMAYFSGFFLLLFLHFLVKYWYK